MFTKRSLAYASMALTISLSSAAYAEDTSAQDDKADQKTATDNSNPEGKMRPKNKAGELLKYLNPVHEKTYLNDSQDRIIKKRSFKGTEIAGAKAISNKELGLFAAVDLAQLKDDNLLKDILAQPSVNGLSVMVPWSSAEPTEGQYDWKQIDHLLETAAQNKKSVILRVTTCGLTDSDTPKWVYDAGAKSVSYTGPDGKPYVMPVFWDSSYLAKWSNFINALGSRYDKNQALHSVGITGGGVSGGTLVIPNIENKEEHTKVETSLKSEFGMNQRQLVQHWKYVADLFPHAFPSCRLNFDIDPPTANRAGEDSLDEISDYLIYRYGQRVYLTRQNVADAKHGFDQYRVLLKFKPDTVTGYRLAPAITAESLDKLAKFALDDGISFVEVPAQFFTAKDDTVVKTLEQLRSKLGYQLVSQNITLPADVKSGQPLKASFTFLNLGSAPAMRPSRQFDKDVASSYKVQLELRDGNGKPVMQSLHTPEVPTQKWIAGKPVTWQEELKMPKLTPGQYSVYLSLVDADTKRKLQLLDAVTPDHLTAQDTIAAGKVQILAE
ncbi:MAG: DUF4832 domain-containing protein [Cyanobacteria bacterium SZAS-4]|nr:DUF4832 domain-containing protein [Cyanobacteria bacterium SZAS-4]